MSVFLQIRTVFVGLLLALAVSFAAPSASAADPIIEAAISQGVVGERVDGYLGLVTGSADANIQRKVNEVNVKRRAVYERLARESGTTVEQVGIVTGEKQIAKTPSGSYYMSANGQWVKK